MSSTHLVSFTTLIKVFAGTFNPKCARSLQFVGPQCGWTWVPEWITLNLICPLLHLAASKESSSLQVKGAFAQFWVFCPLEYSSSCFQSPMSRKLSCSSLNKFCSLSNFRPSSLIICQYFAISVKWSLYVVSTFVQKGWDFRWSMLYKERWYSDGNNLRSAPFL